MKFIDKQLKKTRRANATRKGPRRTRCDLHRDSYARFFFVLGRHCKELLQIMLQDTSSTDKFDIIIHPSRKNPLRHRHLRLPLPLLPPRLLAIFGPWSHQWGLAK